jgi:crotonobetainyl-CoA:carnitine CoA-transferase CaiB-like acyl-CoA transferase
MTEPFLDGVRVLDLSRVLAGPLATLILADLGAEVLKVESPAGDVTRVWGPPFVGPATDEARADAAYFHSINRDKASLVLDLATDEARARLVRLAAAADVVVHNWTPAAAERLGVARILDDAAERAVVLGITGYRGERREEAGYDLVLQAEAGWMAITGPVEEDGGGDPHRVGVAVVDVLTGMMAAAGVSAALFRRERHGGGARLGVSLFQTALWSLVNVTQGHLASGEPSGRWGNRHPNLAPYELFRATDGALVIGVGTDRQYEALLDILAIDGASPLRGLRGLDNAGRVAHRREIARAIDDAIHDRPRADVLAALRERRIPAGPVLRPDEAIRSVRSWDPGAILAFEHAELGRLESLASPLEGAGLSRTHSPPPRLGEGGEERARRWLDPD